MLVTSTHHRGPDVLSPSKVSLIPLCGSGRRRCALWWLYVGTLGQAGRRAREFKRMDGKAVAQVAILHLGAWITLRVCCL